LARTWKSLRAADAARDLSHVRPGVARVPLAPPRLLSNSRYAATAG
jgi:hypothetical protein